MVCWVVGAISDDSTKKAAFPLLGKCGVFDEVLLVKV
jgi:hypothetical protein